MALRVTARRAQRLGTMAPSQTSGTANRACGEAPGPEGDSVLAAFAAGASATGVTDAALVSPDATTAPPVVAVPSAPNTRRCSAKWAVRETVPPAMAAWN